MCIARLRVGIDRKVFEWLFSSLRVYNVVSQEATAGICFEFHEPLGLPTVSFLCGSAPASRELGAIALGNSVGRANGICLTGGSVFGLKTADYLVDRLRSAGKGIPVDNVHIPIVPGSSYFDDNLTFGSINFISDIVELFWPEPIEEPILNHCWASGFKELEGQTNQERLPWSAKWGKILGSSKSHRNPSMAALRITPNGFIFINVINNAFGGPPQQFTGPNELLKLYKSTVTKFASSTVLTFAMTNMKFGREALYRIARMASAGIAASLQPAFTTYDGDIVYLTSTEDCCPDAESSLVGLSKSQLEIFIGDCMARELAVLLASTMS